MAPEPGAAQRAPVEVGEPDAQAVQDRAAEGPEEKPGRGEGPDELMPVGSLSWNIESQSMKRSLTDDSNGSPRMSHTHTVFHSVPSGARSSAADA